MRYMQDWTPYRSQFTVERRELLSGLVVQESLNFLRSEQYLDRIKFKSGALTPATFSIKGTIYTNKL